MLCTAGPNGVRVVDSVAAPQLVAGATLHDAFIRIIPELTFGLVSARAGSLWLGPLEMIRFGPPALSEHAVSWRIDGGLLTRAPGGALTISSQDGEITATVDGYRPQLPAALYAVTQLPFHRLITRLYLLNVRGRHRAAGMPAEPARRFAAGAVDVAICAAAASLAPRRARLPLLIGLLAGYHIAAWSTGGRTVGGALTGQRVVSVDGGRVTIGQAVLRFVYLPAAVLRLRAVHDELAGTDVII